MAKSRPGPGLFLGAIIFFSFAFVVSLILAILFYTRIEAAEHSAAEAAQQLDEYASPSERSSVEVTNIASAETTSDGGSDTIVGKLLEQNARLKQMIVGNRAAEMAQVLSQVSQANVSEGNLLQTIRTLQANRESDQQFIKQLEENVADAREERQKAVAAQQQLDASYKSAVNDLNGQLNTIRQAFASFQQKVEQNATDCERNLAEIRSQQQQKVIAFESQIAQKDQVVARQKARIEELIRDLNERGRFGDVDPTLLPDGKVASIISGQNRVYIDRGKVDRVMLGMTFEVFDRKTGVTRNRFDEYRGKATIEIIRILDNASIARIVRIERGEEVLEGDMIANAVYDPDMIFKFFVFGEFDIDDTGQATQTDRRRIEMLIRQWGADAVDSRLPGGEPAPLSYDVDFLVLGEKPELPEEPDLDTIDPIAAETYYAAKKRFEDYHGLISQAKDLSIPILNQNRFLTMIGHYER